MVYYLPNCLTQPQAIKAAHDAGLDYAITSPIGRSAINGPAGAGYYLAHSSVVLNARNVGYFPDQQVWHKCNGGAFWLGFNKGETVDPQRLIVDEPLDGHWIKLGDGQDWLIPAAVRAGIPKLPMVYGGDDQGKWTKKIDPRYNEFWEAALKVWDAIRCSAEIEVARNEKPEYQPTEDQVAATAIYTEEFRLQIACMAIGVNYRIREPEIQILGLLQDSNLEKITFAIADIPALMLMEESVKKKDLAPASFNGTPGEEASSQTIESASATSHS